MKKVLIIGAGPAGLTAGYQILKNSKEYKVIILEKDSQVGGISKTVTYNGNKMDLGGHRFFTKNKEVQKLWESLLLIQNKPSIDEIILREEKDYPKKGANPEKSDKVFLKRRRISRIYYNNKFFDYPVNLSFKTVKNLGIKDTFISGCSYIKSSVKKLPEDSLENFYINRFGKKLYTIFFRDYTEKLWGISPSEIDSSWGSQRVKGISIKKVLSDYFKRLFRMKNENKEISLINQFNYPKYGPGQMYEELANAFIKIGGELKLNSEVVKIHKIGSSIDYVVYKENGKLIKEEVDIVVSSMPIKDLIIDMNSVPKNIKQIGKTLPYRDFITIGLILDDLKIKNNTKIKTINNNIPDTWMYIQDKKVKLGRIQVFNNWSPYLVKDINNISLGLEYFCTENDKFWNLSDEKLKIFAVKELKNMGIIDNNNAVLDFHVERVKKAYPAYFGSYKYFPMVKQYLNTINNLYCIGRNGMHRYNNMDHSIETGIVCAKNIINNIDDRENIWSVNTEEDYHEEDNKIKK